jgi:hypothetical protein
MLQSSFPLSYPIVDHCCGVCVIRKKAGESLWCVTSDGCTGNCECGKYAADCSIPEDASGTNNELFDLLYTVLCTPCSEQFSSVPPCENLCSGECLLELRDDPESEIRNKCIRCVLERTCEWSDEAPEGEYCDCNLDCRDVFCEAVGQVTVSLCRVKTGENPDICAECP